MSTDHPADWSIPSHREDPLVLGDATRAAARRIAEERKARRSPDLSPTPDARERLRSALERYDAGQPASPTLVNRLRSDVIDAAREVAAEPVPSSDGGEREALLALLRDDRTARRVRRALSSRDYARHRDEWWWTRKNDMAEIVRLVLGAAADYLVEQVPAASSSPPAGGEAGCVLVGAGDGRELTSTEIAAQEEAQREAFAMPAGGEGDDERVAFADWWKGDRLVAVRGSDGRWQNPGCGIDGGATAAELRREGFEVGVFARINHDEGDRHGDVHELPEAVRDGRRGDGAAAGAERGGPLLEPEHAAAVQTGSESLTAPPPPVEDGDRARELLALLEQADDDLQQVGRVEDDDALVAARMALSEAIELVRPPAPVEGDGQAREALIDEICEEMFQRGWTRRSINGAQRVGVLPEDLRAVLDAKLPADAKGEKP